MKWIFGALLAVVMFGSCNNELIVTDNWKDIPVTWALLNPSDTAHYIKVEKVFLDPSQSALEIARIPDSLYYDNITVSLKRIASGEIFNLERVDGALEGYPRQDGVFAEVPNYLYKIKANEINLVPGDEYQLILDRGGDLDPVTANTVIMSEPNLRAPAAGNGLPFRRGANFNFSWDAVEEGGIYELQMRFHYLEKSESTGNVFMPKTASWIIDRNISGLRTEIDGLAFFQSLRNTIPDDPTAVRAFQTIEMVLWVAGQELQEFIRITEANTGITSTQDVPTYTNLSEGLGVFSSRNVLYEDGFTLTQIALDSLKDGVVTSHLNFQ